MIIAKNLRVFRKSHTSGGRSHSCQLIRHSSSMRHSSSTGPSRNVCSSAESVAVGKARSFAQSGWPLKRSASHQTSPASIASRSVSESVGRTRCAHPKMGLLIRSRLNEEALMLSDGADRRRELAEDCIDLGLANDQRWGEREGLAARAYHQILRM